MRVWLSFEERIAQEKLSLAVLVILCYNKLNYAEMPLSGKKSILGCVFHAFTKNE